MRQSIVRSYAVTHQAGAFRLPQTPGWDQVIYASRGMVRLTADTGTWILPPHRAVWVAAGIEHRCVVATRTAMRTLYLSRASGVAPLLDAATRVIEVSPLAREVILHLVARAPLYGDDPTVAAFLMVLREVIAERDVPPLQLPRPSSAACLLAGAALGSDPGAAWSVAALAAEVGLSRRALERRLRQETGLSIMQWLTRLRLMVALERLALGEPVGHVAVAVGCATQSAFGAMFKAQLGASPGAYFASADHGNATALQGS
jgi:AraC-like DNA-binding protein